MVTGAAPDVVVQPSLLRHCCSPSKSQDQFADQARQKRRPSGRRFFGSLDGVLQVRCHSDSEWCEQKLLPFFSTHGSHARFRWVKAPTSEDLTQLTHTIAHRVARYLERQGWLVRDADGANIDRIQVVKGWVDARGKLQENFYDVAWSGDRKLGRDGKLPPMDATSNLGDAGHRWMTAAGLYSDNQAVMNIVMTSDGLFDTPTDVQRTDPPGSDGTFILTFDSCNSGTVEYDIPSISMKGVIPIQRVAEDNIALCQALSAD